MLVNIRLTLKTETKQKLLFEVSTFTSVIRM